MKITGYQIREAIKQWELKKDAASRVFDTVLKKFPGEEKPHPEDLVKQYLDAEIAIAKLQTLQAQYNLYVAFDFNGKAITLCEAVKSLGGYARAEKMWRSAAGSKKREYYSSGDENTVRDPEKQYAVQVVTPMEAVARASAAAKLASSLRAAIATGNAELYEQNSLGPEYFE